MGTADAFSRLPVNKAPQEPENGVLLTLNFSLLITTKDTALSAQEDPILSQVL